MQKPLDIRDHNDKRENDWNDYFTYAATRRKWQEADPYFPQYHFTAPEGRMNDPNGLCFWKGKWHLFYQAIQPGKKEHWGHAVSEDLLHWSDLPYALCPDKEKACYSGATLVEEERVIAAYYGFDSMPEDDGACPYFWPIGDKHLLIHYSHQSGSKYLLGHYDTEGQRFFGIRGGSFNNYGMSCDYAGGTHAPSVTPDQDGGLVAVFNMKEAIRTGICRHEQIVGLPRRLSLTGPKMDELAVEPAVDVDSMRGEEATHIRCYRQRGKRNFDYFEEYGSWDGIGYDTVVTLDNTDSSLLPGSLCRAPEMGAFFLRPEEPLRLRIFIDKSIVEVFVNDRLCLAARVYPSRPDSKGVSICAKEVDTVLLNAKAWQYG